MAKQQNPEKSKKVIKSIVAEASNILEKDGLDSISLRKLATRIGATTGQIYHYFSSKEEIYQFIHSEGFQVFDKCLEPVESILNPYDKIRFIAHSYLQFAKDHVNLYSLLFSGKLKKSEPTKRMTEILSPDVLNARTRSFGRLIKAVEIGIEQKKFKCNSAFDGASFLWVSLHGIVELIREGWMNNPDGTREPIIHEFLDKVPRFLISSLGGNPDS